MYLLEESQYKTKLLMQKTMQLCEHRLNWVLFIYSCAGLGVGIYIFKSREQVEKIATPTASIDPIAIRVVINEVLLKDQINRQLGKVISDVCQKPSVNHNLSKQLNKIF
jgi:hypothetical protein